MNNLPAEKWELNLARSRYNYVASRLKASKRSVLRANFDKVFEGDSELEAIGRAYRTRQAHLVALEFLINVLKKKPIEKTTKSDILKITSIWNGEKHSYGASVYNTYRGIIINFLKRYKVSEEVYNWWKPMKDERSRVTPDMIVSREEIVKLANASKGVGRTLAESKRNKALIMVAFDSNCRPSEVLNCRVKDVELKDRHGLLNVWIKKLRKQDSKLLTFSYPALLEWIEVHPQKDNPEAPLWISYGRATGGQALGLSGYRNVLSCANKLAGRKKPIFPYLMRFSRTSDFVREGYSISEIQESGSWSSASTIPFDVYSKVRKKDLYKKQLQKEGIEKKEAEEIDPLKPRPCLSCNNVYDPTVEICPNCRVYLNPKRIVENEKIRVEELKKERLDFAMKILEATQKINTKAKPISMESIKIIAGDIVKE